MHDEKRTPRNEVGQSPTRSADETERRLEEKARERSGRANRERIEEQIEEVRGEGTGERAERSGGGG